MGETMGTSVGALSELQLCFPYLSCPGNCIVKGSDLTVGSSQPQGRETVYNLLNDDGEVGKREGVGGERERENESPLQTEMPLSPSTKCLFPNLEQVPRILLSLPSA